MYLRTWGAPSDYCVNRLILHLPQEQTMLLRACLSILNSTWVKEGRCCLTFLKNGPDKHWVMLMFSQGLRQYSPFTPSGELGQSVFLQQYRTVLGIYILFARYRHLMETSICRSGYRSAFVIFFLYLQLVSLFWFCLGWGLFLFIYLFFCWTI